jgi:hypothetical protein
MHSLVTKYKSLLYLVYYYQGTFALKWLLYLVTILGH